MNQQTLNNKQKKAVVKERKLAQNLGKDPEDYDPVKFYGELEWTRVKARSQFSVQRIVTFSLGPDIHEDIQETLHRVKNDYEWGTVLFDPDDLNKQGEKMKTENFVMSDVDLVGYARLVTRLRRDF